MSRISSPSSAAICIPPNGSTRNERLIEHARAPCRVHDMAARQKNSCGAVAWCAFDYNTHSQFGSGDKNGLQGVMDAFRLPKYAAYFYMSQMPPSRKKACGRRPRSALHRRRAGRVIAPDRLHELRLCDDLFW